MRTKNDSPYSKYLIDAPAAAKVFADSPEAKIRMTGTSFSDAFGFKRLGAHWVTLPPGARTSLPHAESLEEEFVFVIAGHPHVWIDGFVHELRPHCAVGFPAGTGIAHCLINNTDTDAVLFMSGDRSKRENLCSFPKNPEQEKESPIFWKDSPVRPLGPHSGLPGPVRPEEIGKEWPSCIVDCTKLEMQGGFHYPGDSESGSEYARLTEKIGLRNWGIAYETLQPGRRCAFPHSHMHDEEFAFILSGTATIWMNGFNHEAGPGVAVGFPANSNIAHSIVNNTEEPVLYLILGDAQELGIRDFIYYPEHEFRNEQCRIGGYFWEDRPKDLPFGIESGRPKKGLGDHFALRHFQNSDEQTVLSLYRRSANFFSRVDGCAPTIEIVRHDAVDGPAKKDPSYRKEYLILEHRGDPVGIVDLHINHPEPGAAYVGLLLLPEDRFGKGLGKRFYRLAEDYLKRVFKTKKILLGVSEENRVEGFWIKMGFTANGKTYSWKGREKTALVHEYQKEIT